MKYRIFLAKLLIFFCLVAETIQIDEELVSTGLDDLTPEPRILGGFTAAADQFPYVVSVRVNGDHICSGTIISQKYILTAAQCVYSLLPSFLSVRAGSVNRTSGGVVVGVATVNVHPDFLDYNNDIALLKIDTKLNYSNVIQPIPLAGVDVPDEAPVTIAGWGRVREAGTKPELLQYSRSLRTYSNENCTRIFGKVAPSILCLFKSYGYGICGGDAGGPAVYRGILVGIASYHTSNCGVAVPDGFTKISYYKDWIAENSCIHSNGAATVPN
ncbi:chymotrypsin-2 [Ceratitis capitata]|uniref:Chymotrypsin-2 n=1 Tax=Ceratitis capitata TaxID=7213 RepID=W8BMX6_CERCA|nr:chymotrypsin-2 [Ceratitis capitata]